MDFAFGMSITNACVVHKGLALSMWCVAYSNVGGLQLISTTRVRLRIVLHIYKYTVTQYKHFTCVDLTFSPFKYVYNMECQ